MRRLFIFLFCIFMFTDVVYAQQFKVWGNTVVNKQMITHVVTVGKDRIRIFYSSGDEGGATLMSTRTELVYSSQTERDKKLKEMMTWLNSKD